MRVKDRRRAGSFIARRPYRWVRHPWYLVAIMLFWSCVDFTSDRLFLNVLWTDWVCLDLPRTGRSGVRLRGRLRTILRACSDAHSPASGSWDVVRSLSQLLFTLRSLLAIATRRVFRGNGRDDLVGRFVAAIGFVCNKRDL